MTKLLVAKIFVGFTFVIFTSYGELADTKTTDADVQFEYQYDTSVLRDNSVQKKSTTDESSNGRSDRNERRTDPRIEMIEKNMTSSLPLETVDTTTVMSSKNHATTVGSNENHATTVMSGKNDTTTIRSIESDAITVMSGKNDATTIRSIENHATTVMSGKNDATTIRSIEDHATTVMSGKNHTHENVTESETSESRKESEKKRLENSVTESPSRETVHPDLRLSSVERRMVLPSSHGKERSLRSTDDKQEQDTRISLVNDALSSIAAQSEETVEPGLSNTSRDLLQNDSAIRTNEGRTTVASSLKPEQEVSKIIHDEAKKVTEVVEVTTASSRGDDSSAVTEARHESQDLALFSLEHNSSSSAHSISVAQSDGTVEAGFSETSRDLPSDSMISADESRTTNALAHKPEHEVSKLMPDEEKEVTEVTTASSRGGDGSRAVTETRHESHELTSFALEHNSSSSALSLSAAFTAPVGEEESTSIANIDYTSQTGTLDGNSIEETVSQESVRMTCDCFVNKLNTSCDVSCEHLASNSDFRCSNSNASCISLLISDVPKDLIDGSCVDLINLTPGTDDFVCTDAVSLSTVTLFETSSSALEDVSSSIAVKSTSEPNTKLRILSDLSVVEGPNVLFLSWNQSGDYDVGITMNERNVTDYCNSSSRSYAETKAFVTVIVSCDVGLFGSPGELLRVIVSVGTEPDNESLSYTYVKQPADLRDPSVSFPNDSLLCVTWTQEGFYDGFEAKVFLAENISYFTDNVTISGNDSDGNHTEICCLDFSRHGFCAASLHRLQLKAKRREKWSSSSSVSFYSAPNSPLISCPDQTNSSFLLEIGMNDSENCSDLDELLQANFTFLYRVSAPNWTEENASAIKSSIVLKNSTTAMPLVNDREAGVTYTVEVSAVVGGVESKSSSVSCTTIPNPPLDVEASVVTIHTAFISWHRPSGRVREFSVCCHKEDDPKNQSTCSNRTQGLNGTCAGLIPGEIYTAVVTSHLESEKNISSSYSIPIRFIAEPLPPTEVRLQNTTHNEAVLSMECRKNTRCTGFRFPDFKNASLVRSSGLNYLYRLNGLDSSEQYNVGVRTVSNGTEGAERESSQAEFITFWTLPDRVPSMNLSSPDSVSLKVVWNCPKKRNGITGYNIQLRNSSGSVLRNETHSETEPIYAFRNLTPNTNYTVILCAVNLGGRGQSIDDTIMTLKMLPAEASDAIMLAAAVAAVVLLLVLVVILLVVLFVKRKPKFAVPSSKRPSDALGFPNPSFSLALESKDVCDRMKPDPVPFDRFLSHVEVLHNDSDFLFSSEYALLTEMSPKFAQTAAEMEDNRIKNRYSNILPFDHSRVKLIPLDEDDLCSDYINASYMPGFSSKREFIAAQGPMKSTTDDFWRMIWEQHVTTIVMVTNLQERGREKCAEYWPMEDEPQFYGDLQVQMVSESQLNYYIIRVLEVKLGEKKRIVKHLHFVAWPDFGCPENTAVLLDFVTGVRSHMSSPSSPQNSGPILVHCSAGVGRTGTFILIDRLLQHIQSRNIIDIFGLVLEMRNYRCNMIQTESQYIFAYECIKTAIERQLESNSLEEVDENEDESVYQNVTSKGVGVPREESLYQNVNQTPITVLETESVEI